MKVLRKHKKATIIVVIIIFLLLIFFLLMNFFYTNGKSKYGDRLEGIKDVPIKEDLKNDIIDTLKTKANVTNASIDIRGKIINIIIDADKDAQIEAMKTNVNDILAKVSDEEKSFYDIQTFIIQNNGTTDGGFRLIGYKSNTSDVFVWSSNE